MNLPQDLEGQALSSGPTTQSHARDVHRLASLDLIRGIAVLGILFANITAFGQPMVAYYWPEALPRGGTRIDEAVWFFQLLFVDGKMRGLFTLLFGAGMMLFVGRVWARGGTRWLQLRRLAWLLAFGLLHFLFLFRGDILFTYALWGSAALLFVTLDPVKKMVIGLMLYFLGGVMMALFMAPDAYYEQIPSACASAQEDPCEKLAEGLETATAQIQQEQEIYGSGSFLDILDYTVNEQSIFLAKAAVFGILETLPLMLIGMALYGFGMFSGEIDRTILRKWGWIVIGAGTALTLPIGLWALISGFPYYLTTFLFNAATQIPRLPVVLGLAALLMVWTPALVRSGIGQRLVAAGRMAFSNYIGTSIVMMFVFHGWALGLYGRLGRLELLAVVLLGWVLMLAWSKPWLAHFRHGPLEWLWRCLTYRELLPFRR